MMGSGRICVWRESGLVLVRLQESSFSRREDVFTFDLVYKETYKFCTFNAICKDNAAINCITVRHKKIHSRQL
jgi:hypothetical protein